MNKISGFQKIKLFYQQTISLKVILFFIVLTYIWFIFIEMKPDNLNGLGDFFKEIWDNLLISNMSGFLLALPKSLMIILTIAVLIKLDNLSYLFKKNIYVLPGKIIKSYHDRNEWSGDNYRPNSYDSKKISLFSNCAITYRNHNAYTSYRSKAQSNDEKFTTSWVCIQKKLLIKEITIWLI